MNKAAKLLLAGTLLAGLALGLWSLHDQQAARQQARTQAWTAYLRGPLSDLLYGFTQAQPILKLKVSRWTPAQRHQLEASRDAVLGSESALGASLLEIGRDPFFVDLQEAKSWQAQLSEMARDWLMLEKDPAGRQQAVLAERALRKRLAAALYRQRAKVADELHLSQDAWLEQNALLYSLAED